MHTEELTKEESERIDSVVRWIRNRRGYMAAAVVRLGSIHFTDSVKTAGIAVNGLRVQLFFNPGFFAEIEAKELAGVLIHESFHFLFRHQFRAELIHDKLDRRLFNIACEAVINDLISKSFPDFALPGSPIRGMDVIGRDTSDLSAEQVMILMKREIWKGIGHTGKLDGAALSDDHSLWDSQDGEDSADGEEGSGKPASEDSNKFSDNPHKEGWTRDSDAQVEQIVSINAEKDACGTKPLGLPRSVPRNRVRTNLRRYLEHIITPSQRYRTLWNRVSRKALSVYPDVILPLYEPENRLLNVLIALDASGSVPSSFLVSAVNVARRKIPGGRTTLISFDTKVYEFTPGHPTVRGGGGTRVQAVEEYATENGKRYPDVIIVFSDGLTPSPHPRYPDRWIWILPEKGSTRAIPRESRFAYFK